MAGKGVDFTRNELETYISYDSREETFAEGGEYLPLSVWAAKDFDAASIERGT